MKKIIFFPYHPDLKTVIKYKDALRDYQIAGFLSYKEDANLIQPLNQALGLADISYEQLLQDSDAIIILDNYRNYKVDKYYKVIEDALSRQKEVYIIPLAQSQLKLENYQGQYQLLERLPDALESIEAELKGRQGVIRLYEIDIPVIGIIGQGINCDKFETQLLLKEVLEEGYETTVVSSNALGALFGCYTMPSFFYSDLSFQEKIIKFNHYIKEISKIETPDVMVLGIPEGVLPFEKHEFHHFAEYPLVVSSAVLIDMAILCTYYLKEPIFEDGLKLLADFCQHKFNAPISAIAISKTAIEIPDADSEKIIFEYLDEQHLHKHYPDLKKLNLPTVNMFDRLKAKVTIRNCLRQLEENVRAI